MMLHCQKSQRFGHVEVPSRSRPLRGSHESRWHRIFNKVLPCYLLFSFSGFIRPMRAKESIESQCDLWKCMVLFSRISADFRRYGSWNVAVWSCRKFVTNSSSHWSGDEIYEKVQPDVVHQRYIRSHEFGIADRLEHLGIVRCLGRLFVATICFWL